MRLALELLADICRNYAEQAREMASQSGDETREKERLQMAEALENITTAAPATLREGIQLYWLYALISGVVNYGRADTALGDLLVAELESGALTQEEALELIRNLIVRVGGFSARFVELDRQVQQDITSRTLID